MAWIECLKKELYHGELNPDDYLFPHFNRSGHPMRGQGMMSHDFVQDWIDSFAERAGIAHPDWKFTTHCFRRGGAQYRFMFAPLGKKWPLRTVRWWGGWAEGEQVTYIQIKYPSLF